MNYTLNNTGGNNWEIAIDHHYSPGSNTWSKLVIATFVADEAHANDCFEFFLLGRKFPG